MSDKLKLVYTVLVLAALVYAERRLIEPRLTGARLSALVQEALVYKVLVSQEWHPYSARKCACVRDTLSGWSVDKRFTAVMKYWHIDT